MRLTVFFCTSALLIACSTSPSGFSGPGDGSADSGRTLDGGTAGDVSVIGFGDGGANVAEGGDPTTCAGAAAAHSYIGCDYWPTVVANPVWSIFDFGVVVGNAGAQPASVAVTGPSGVNQTITVQPNNLGTFYLPWVPALKGPDFDNCSGSPSAGGSVLATRSAYHLVSSVPVTVYQFNALEYKGEGGPAGKDWSSCPGNTFCLIALQPIGCFSFSNDASLLLPSTAMTGNYRVSGAHGDVGVAPYFAVTATQDGTQVVVSLSPTGDVTAGSGIRGTAGGGVLAFSLNAGDVAQVVGGVTPASDLSGSLVQATKPVQVIAGVPCIQTPLGAQACDHTEQSVFPVETLGKHYIVTVPTSPHAQVIGHIVRFYGNHDGTVLTYSPANTASCPATLNAGQVAECGPLADNFEVTADHEFAVGTFMLGGSLADPNAPGVTQEGDPSQSLFASVEQFRAKYVFLAPKDYQENYADIVVPANTSLTLDGAMVNAAPEPIGAGGFGVVRLALGPGPVQMGAHVLTASRPVGLQVMGYGQYTSYQYPGGLDLARIAPPPPPPPPVPK